MNILLRPFVGDLNKIWYEIENQKITATINNITDTFDFTDMPDGELVIWDEEGNQVTETVLDEMPIFKAKKEDGVLWVEILFSIDFDEADERLLFPDWMSLEEFNALMKELSEREEDLEEEEEEGEIIG